MKSHGVTIQIKSLKENFWIRCFFHTSLKKDISIFSRIFPHYQTTTRIKKNIYQLPFEAVVL